MFKKLLTIGILTLVLSIPLANAATASDISDRNFYKNLPVASVKTHDTANNWGTVIYLPQYHKSPGSKDEDPKNNKAEITQKETYKIAEKIIQNGEVEIAMVEGKLTGPLDANEKAEISEELKNKTQRTKALNDLKNALKNNPVDPQMKKNAEAEIQKHFAKKERSLYLKGGIQILWGEDKVKNLVGSENKETLDKSRDVVRDYIYIQDQISKLSRANPLALNNKIDLEQITRLKQLKSQGKDNMGINNEKLQKYKKLSEMIKAKKGIKNTSAKTNGGVEELLKKAKETGNIKAAEAIENFINQIRTIEKNESKKLNTTSISKIGSLSSIKAPSRTNNPYAKIFDKTQLLELRKQSENKINSIIIEQRNREAAENFAKALKTNKEKTGILQFGAGHEAGLVKELQKQGLDVIVVTPNEVAKGK